MRGIDARAFERADAAGGEREIDGAARRCTAAVRGSGRRSNNVTANPRRASRSASSEPASPAPTMFTARAGSSFKRVLLKAAPGTH